MGADTFGSCDTRDMHMHTHTHTHTHKIHHNCDTRNVFRATYHKCAQHTCSGPDADASDAQRSTIVDLQSLGQVGAGEQKDSVGHVGIRGQVTSEDVHHVVP